VYNQLSIYRVSTVHTSQSGH